MLLIHQALASNPYPGRGILLGMSADGQSAICAYFIMGRSENSRNRVFAPEGDGLRTQPFDASKVSDPSLIIYAPVKTAGQHTIVTNGDQTDTIEAALASGGTFEAALRTRTFEPDGPHFTPRISGLLTRNQSSFSYKLNILKSAQGNPNSCLRFFYEYDVPLPGVGHLIHTYANASPGGEPLAAGVSGSPLPSFTGEPTPIALPGNLDDITDALWQSLNEDNKVALFVRFLSLDGGIQTRIVNKWQ